ncbi:dehydrogenase xptC [Colletotrichum spaethianum]|uniref:Dehydrogenase xptC n=1 Tax=Colletotrichum spaethianum TaxID=700344 RepID=A0AA37PEZ2_9PEZI|nr:dehydrogenase xptC [Colletotrichum spaethianum]GKT50974.1 dehydrogenase xptC [Colletotrichum spaethianum]
MALGNRLSEDPTNSLSYQTWISELTLYRDSGDKEIMIPRYYVAANGPYTGAKYNWNDSTVPQVNLGNREVVFTQGKLIGGGSGLNAMVYDRGRAADYDAWADLGNPGWNFDSLLPYFRRVGFQTLSEPLGLLWVPTNIQIQAETFTPPSDDQVEEFGITWNPECHGTDGPVQSSYCRYVYPQHNNFMAAFESLGVSQPLDQSCGNTLGAYLTTHSIHPTNQSRSFGRTAWYDSSIDRANLHVLTETHVTKLVTAARNDTVVVTGVEFAASRESGKASVNVVKEAILSAGSLRSPQLLMLSGIGQKAQVEEHRIDSVVDLPGVGANLQDHAINAMVLSNLENETFDSVQGDLYYENRTGRWTDGLPATLAFIPYLDFASNPDVLDSMDASTASTYLANITDPSVRAGYKAQIEHVVANHRDRKTAGQELMVLNGGTFLVTILMHPLSRGTVTLASADPFDHPVIDPRYLSHPADRQLYADALKYDRKIVATEEFQAMKAVEVAPGGEITDDASLGAYAAAGLSTVWHPAGTCAMMPIELGGVVDSHLRVYGVSNLRIVDASIIPMLPAAHVQGTTYAIAEKAADMIKSGI